MTEAVTCNDCPDCHLIQWPGPRRGAISNPHCRTCHGHDHRACGTCGICMPSSSRWDRCYCSSSCRAKGHREREDARLERAVWEAEHPKEAANQPAELEKFRALEDSITPPEGRAYRLRIEDLKNRADRCGKCDQPFFEDAVIYRRRNGRPTDIRSPVLPFCIEHRCSQADGYHNRDAGPGRHYRSCRCEDHHWGSPSPCLGCGRPVSHPRYAAWRLAGDWINLNGSPPATPRIFCGLDCKRKVLAVEARARRMASRPDCATCSLD